MTVDLVDNPEKYEEVYASEPEDDDVDEEADEEKPLEESPETEALAKELAEVEATFSNAKDRHASATMQLREYSHWSDKAVLIVPCNQK